MGDFNGEKVLIYFDAIANVESARLLRILDDIEADKELNIETYSCFGIKDNPLAERYEVKATPTAVLFERESAKNRDDMVEIRREVGLRTKANLIKFIKGE